MKILIITFAISIYSLTAMAVNPSSAKVKIYKVSASPNTNCSDAVTIQSVSSPDYVEMTSVNISGALADGTYPCIIFEIGDNIKFTPESTTGSCAGGTEYTINVCRSGTYRLADGTTGTCTTSEERVGVFISTLSTNTGGGSGNAFYPPTSGSATDGIKLDGALVKSGAKTTTFVLNLDGKIDGTGGSCDMQPPLFQFR